MSRLERPTLRLKLELEVPDLEGGPSKKFSVSRALKAKWGENPATVFAEINDEINNYRGSFIGDTVTSLSSLYFSEEKPINVEEAKRKVDVAKWCASVIDHLVLSGIDDELYGQFIEEQNIVEWDGEIRKLDSITQKEVREVDMDKVSILLSPLVKHALFLISKKM